jgi:hypothetical protein
MVTEELHLEYPLFLTVIFQDSQRAPGTLLTVTLDLRFFPLLTVKLEWTDRAVVLKGRTLLLTPVLLPDLRIFMALFT